MASMSRPEYWAFLRDFGWEPEKKYQQYTTEELAGIYDSILEKMTTPPAPPTPDEAGVKLSEPGPQSEMPEQGPNPSPQGIPTEDGGVKAPFYTGIEGVAGTRPSTLDAEEIVEIDAKGRHWIQKEVRKPAAPQPRGRRKVTYQNSGTRQVTVTNERGDTETVEMPGDRNVKGEARVTLPSYQVGIYRTRLYPFKVYTYGGKEGFDLFEVERYYGDRTLVPESVETTYVANFLVYDMKSVINAIRAEYSEQRLAAGRSK